MKDQNFKSHNHQIELLLHQIISYLLQAKLTLQSIYTFTINCYMKSRLSFGYSCGACASTPSNIIIQFISNMKQQSQFQCQHGKYYRCRPSLYESLALGPYLLDIDGTHLFIYHLQELTFKTSIEVLSKEDIFCAKLRAISDNLVGVFGMYNFWVISLDTLKVVKPEGVSLPTMIENVEARNNYLAILTSDEEGEDKLLYFWRFNNDGKIQKQYSPFDVHLPEYEECSEDRLEIAIFQSIDFNPKVYLFWKTTSNLLELDPERKLEERYNKSMNITFLTDIDVSHYCEISQGKIKICSKKDTKQVGSLMNAKEQFKKIIIKHSQPKEYFSISNQGVKRWLLENNTEPLLYTESDKYPVQNLYLNGKGELVGINIEKKFILIWKSDKEVIIHNFPNEVIKKIMRVNQTQVCLLLEATLSKEVQNQVQVQKHNKMEIYDFEKDTAVAKKAVLKLQYKIDIDSAIVGLDGSVIFILNEFTEQTVKKYIFRWSPFNQDKKKQSKKRQIVEANTYHSIKLYPFERILTFKKGKDTEMYDPFGKATQSKSQVTLFDFNAKKIGDYQISGQVRQIELGNNNQIYALGKDKFSIFQINANYKNRLEKKHQLEVSVSFVYPLGNYIIMKKDASIIVYDQQFDFVMKQDENEEVEGYKLMKINENNFILASEQELSLWDLQTETKTVLTVKDYSPNMVQLMGSRLLLADKWIRSFDFYQLTK